jgi:hypothetical protein
VSGPKDLNDPHKDGGWEFNKRVKEAAEAVVAQLKSNRIDAKAILIPGFRAAELRDQRFPIDAVLIRV